MSAEHNKEKLLYLVHRIPYPPNKGDKIRSYNILKYLSARYQVYLGTFIDDPEDWQYMEKVRQMCSESYFGKLNPKMATIRSMSGLLSGRPLTLPYYRDKGLQQWVDKVIQEQGISKVLVFSSGMAQYMDRHHQGMNKSIIDFVDIDSDKWRQYSASKKWPLNLIYKREANTLLKYEKKYSASFDQSLFVSETESNMFRQLSPDTADKVAYINNGVDTAYFSPDREYSNPYQQGERALVFTGAMDYWANADAVEWFSHKVFPIIRNAVPDITFYIVGSKPSEKVCHLGQQAGIKVTGAVHDVRPYIACADLVVAPMRIARGVQNKVLEAMAMGKTVVTTQQGYDGITATKDKEIIIESEVIAMAQRIIDFYINEHEEDIGTRARKYVIENYGWDKSLERLGASI